MTPTQHEHLRAIDAHLTALLDLAAKRTPGEWEYGNDAVWSDCNGEGNSPEEVCYQIGLQDASFIASCADNAEAGWRSTKEAIKLLKDFITSSLTAGIERQCAQATLESILAEWPIEKLKLP